MESDSNSSLCQKCEISVAEYRFLNNISLTAKSMQYCGKCCHTLQCDEDMLVIIDENNDVVRSLFYEEYLDLVRERLPSIKLPLSVAFEQILEKLLDFAEEKHILTLNPFHLLTILNLESEDFRKILQIHNLNSDFFLHVETSTSENSLENEAHFGQDLQNFFLKIINQAIQLQENYIGLKHVFAVLDEIRFFIGLTNGQKIKFDFSQLEIPKEEFHSLIPTPTLDKFGIDLTHQARLQQLPPIIGREEEINQVIRILCRYIKHNPLLIGQAGVGKTAIVEGLAQKIARNQVPALLRHKRIIYLNFTVIVAGTRYRGDFEKRMLQILQEIQQAHEQIIIFIDEAHILTCAGGSQEGAVTAANILKPALARQTFQCIAATTTSEYTQYMASDHALTRRFQLLTIKEPSIEETHRILEGYLPQLQNYYKVTFDSAVIPTILKLTQHFLSDRYFPDKALDLLDEAAATAMLNQKSQVTLEIVIEVMQDWIKQPKLNLLNVLSK